MTQHRNLPTYLSIEEAATVMSVSTKTIRRRISDGTIPAYHCGNRPIRIKLDDLEAALERIPAVNW
ncbi:helix-turn-helix domain-containing protein [Nocardioides daphniae]|uniref:DNA-binding protein n=1 Tax=Nocardioides daphniae TaxID=402297 RepID=A0A4P7UBS2_9ACTN|nr:helix-turn-helix domain-containing protein [Nocardioides daphniae]QCC77446.1 DNA-binding protein [Nocardioides daphniae]GGD32010.1 hypothetical protein GCM10007231_34400 [Nocardioides daphniae]